MSTPTDPKRMFAIEVVKRLQDASFQALWAGGCVRDLLLQRDAQDYDVATNATPDEVVQLFGRRRTQTVGASFGVILVMGPRKAGPVEVATFRSDGEYRDGRHPEHVEFTSAEHDAQRRDFTINGMFFDPLTEQVTDFVGGQRDLDNKVVRAIGIPGDRMREDKLRMLRAVRFAATLEFELEQLTFDAIRDMATELREVSAERVSQELQKMLLSPNRARAIQLCRELGLIDHMLPGVFPAADADQDQLWETTLSMLERLENPTFETSMACLLHQVDQPKQVAAANKKPSSRKRSRVTELCHELRLSNQQTATIDWLVGNQQRVLTGPDLPQAALFRLLSEPLIDPLLDLVDVGCRTRQESTKSVEYCRDILRETPPEVRNPAALIGGDDLIKMGLRPGKHFKDMLDKIRDAQLGGHISTPTEALDLARQLQPQSSPKSPSPPGS